jgi:hypothetical protein
MAGLEPTIATGTGNRKFATYREYGWWVSIINDIALQDIILSTGICAEAALPGFDG